MSNQIASLPLIGMRRLPILRGQAILLMAAFNEIMLGVDTWLAHYLNQTIRVREWIPIIFGFVAGGVLLLAGIVARRNRTLAANLATLVFVASIVVGVLGAYFHLVRGTLPTAPVGERISIYLLIWSPPILAPFAFAGIGVLGISAAWPEEPLGSGILRLPFGWRLALPYSKTQAYFFLVSLGTLVALVSSVLDHARAWESPWLWLPLVVGVFATVVSAGAGAAPQPLSRADLLTFFWAMVLLIVVGVLGAYFHIQADLNCQQYYCP